MINNKINLHKLNAARMDLLGKSFKFLSENKIDDDIHYSFELPFYAMNISIKDVLKYSSSISSFIEDSGKWMSTLSDDSDLEEFNRQYFKLYPEAKLEEEEN